MTMLDLACDRPGCPAEAHTTAKSGGVNGWFTAFIDGRRVNACGIAHLQPALTFANPNAVCGYNDCSNPSGSDHFYCTERCRDRDRQEMVGMASIYGSATLTATVAAIRERLDMVGSNH